MSFAKDDALWRLIANRPSKEDIEYAEMRKKSREERDRLHELNTPVTSHEYILSNYGMKLLCPKCGHEKSLMEHHLNENNTDCVSGIELDL